MGRRGRKPIRSALAHDPDIEERLDAFIVGLGERIDLIQEAEQAGDLKASAQRARELAREAERLGFPPLADAALHAAASCEEENTAAAHARIVKLTDVVQRVRLGHRGAV
jgi:hypothetical protein